MDKLTIGERIDHYMHKYHMNCEQLAAKMGMSKPTFIYHKNHPDMLRYSEIKTLCRMFHISVEMLLEGR